MKVRKINGEWVEGKLHCNRKTVQSCQKLVMCSVSEKTDTEAQNGEGNQGSTEALTVIQTNMQCKGAGREG